MPVGLFESGRGEVLFGVFLFCVSGVLQGLEGGGCLAWANVLNK